MTNEQANEIKGFKVGEKVRIIHDECYHGIPIDTIVTVLTLDGDGMVRHIKKGKKERSLLDYEIEKL